MTRAAPLLLLLAALALIGCAPRAPRTPTPPPEPTATIEPSPTPAGPTFYVSRNGSNADGRSWTSAWNELDQVDWRQLARGSTLLLDGGPAEMTYRTPLVVRASGVAIRLAGEPGRNGRAVIFGGRATPLPYYGQPRREYPPPTRGNDYGIEIGTEQDDDGGARIADVTIDGTKWGGIRVRGARAAGVRLRAGNARVTLRNLEIDDNGDVLPEPSSGGTAWYPDNPGIILAGVGHVFERLAIHDNGQDAIQSAGSTGTSFADLTVRGSWLYATRTKPDGSIWNLGEQNHPDGIQIFSGGEQAGLTVERSVIGPLLMHGLILGDAGCRDDPTCDWAVVSGVTVRDSLFYGSFNASIHSGGSDQVPGRPLPRAWRIERVTSDLPRPRDRFASEWPAQVDFAFGAANQDQLTVVDSIFTGGAGARVPAAGRYTSNVQTGDRDVADAGGRRGSVLGPNVDPRYADPAAYGSRRLDASFALAPGSPAAGKGSPITAARQLPRR